MAIRQDVLEFLNFFKGVVELYDFRVKDRTKNIEALLNLGISCAERKEIILGLTPEDYIAGPKPDDTDSEKDVWEFGKIVKETEVYIKLRVAEDPRTRGRYHAMLWSFHPAEYPIKYPPRGGGK